jgi:hypothetical protein
LEQWGAQLAQDITAVTGQTNSPKLYSFQLGTDFWPADGAGFYPQSKLAQWQTANDNPATNAVIGPRYQLIHQTDNVHLYNVSYQRQGEYAAKRIAKDILLGQETDLRPTNSTWVSPTNLLVTFNQNSLVWDTNLVRGATNYGFAFFATNSSALSTLGQDAAPTNIYSLAIAGLASNQVLVTVSFVPPSGVGALTYALNSTNGAPGPVNGARGNLRDSDPTTGYVTSSNLYDWSVSFALPCPHP